MNHELYQKIKEVDEVAAADYVTVCTFKLAGEGSGYPSDDLMCAFSWQKTPQGHDYWSEVNVKLDAEERRKKRERDSLSENQADR